MSEYNPPDPLPPPLTIFNNLNWIVPDMIQGGGGIGGQGPQGFQGIGLGGQQGRQGFQGVQGVQGVQGIQGVQGLQGLQGIQGTQGWQGLVGPSNTLYTETFGATTTFNIDTNGALQRVVLTGSSTLAVTLSTNRTFVLLLSQGGAGSNTVSWFSTISWSGGSAPTLTTTVGKTDTFGFIRTSAGNYLGYIIGLNA